MSSGWAMMKRISVASCCGRLQRQQGDIALLVQEIRAGQGLMAAPSRRCAGLVDAGRSDVPLVGLRSNCGSGLTDWVVTAKSKGPRA